MLAEIQFHFNNGKQCAYMTINVKAHVPFIIKTEAKLRLQTNKQQKSKDEDLRRRLNTNYDQNAPDAQLTVRP